MSTSISNYPKPHAERPTRPKTAVFRKPLVCASSAPVLLAALLAAVISTTLPAQTVLSPGTQTTLGSGFSAPAGVAVDSTGNVFVADINKGVMKLTPNGGQTPIGNNLVFPAGVAVDGAGNVFVADNGDGRVVKLTPDGTQTTVSSGLSSPFGLAVDRTGNLFVGGLNQNSIIKIAPNGTQTKVGSSFVSPSGVAVDRTGNVFVADQGSKQVVRVALNGTQTTVGGGFNDPHGVAVDSAGNLFVTDVGNRQVVKIAPDNRQTTMSSDFNEPFGIAVDSADNVFVTDMGNKQVVKIQLGLNAGNVRIGYSATLSLNYQVENNTTFGTPLVLTDGAPNQDFTLANDSTCNGSLSAGSSCTVTVTFAPRFAGLRRGAVQLVDASGNTLLTTYVQGTGVGPQIAFGSTAQVTVFGNASYPLGVAVDAAGNLFVANTNTSSIMKVALDGTQTTLPVTGLSGPYSVAVDAAGTVFIADTFNNRVVKFTTDGTQTALPIAGLSDPYGVAVDGAGNLFVAAMYPNGIIRIAPDGTQTTLPVTGTIQLGTTGVAVDGVGNLFVADAANQRVVKLTPDGTQTTISTGLGESSGIAVDSAGNLFVVTFGEHSHVIKIAPDGTKTDIGSGLHLSFGIAVDGAGNVFVADAGNNRIVELPRSQPPSLTFTPTPIGSTSTPQSFTVENSGNAPLTGSALTVAGNFAQVPGSGTPADCTAGFSLVSGNVCNVSLSFTPTAAGSLSGTVTLTDNSANVNPATQTVQLSGTGLPARQTITFAPLPSPMRVGTTVTLNATATSGLPVSFTSTTTGICAVSGTTVQLFTAGTCTLRATQDGNASYKAASPVMRSFMVSDFALIATPSSQTVLASHSASFTLKLTPLDGFTGSVDLSYIGGPPNSTCVFSMSPVQLNKTSTVTMTLSSTGPAGSSAPFPITITARSGSIVHSVTVNVTVK